MDEGWPKMMNIYIYDHGWKQVETRNDDLWLRNLSNDEKAELLDKIAKGEVKIAETNVIRQGH